MIDTRVRNIGTGCWNEQPYKTWVSKSDVTEYLRCPYRVYLSYKEGIPYRDFKEPALIEARLNPGIEFEAEYVAKLPIEQEADIETVADREVILRSSELILNHNLGIRGILDLIATEKGKLIPIEVKSHKSITDSDRLELAFYWRLLEPLRAGRPRRKGYVWLNNGEKIEVRLTKIDFDRLASIISEIRLIRERGTKPALVKECDLCRFKEEHLQQVVRDGGLTLILDIGAGREPKLRQLGIEDVPALADANIQKLWQQWREIDPYVPSLIRLGRMKSHAQAWLEGVPKIIGNAELPNAKHFIFLDLEYGTCIFLVGALVLEKAEKTTIHLEFAQSISDERDILMSLCDLLRAYPHAPVLTWNGNAADLPQLKSAWFRQKLPKRTLDDLIARHFDLYQAAYNSIRLPIYGLGLKVVAEYFGFERKHRDLSGIMMPFMYQQYLVTKNETAKSKIRQTIMEYNQDDLEALALVYARLREMGLIEERG